MNAQAAMAQETTARCGAGRGKERDELRRLVYSLSRMDERDRVLLLSMAEGMARHGAEW